MALAGILLLLVGMVRTAILFRQEYTGPIPAVMQGFVPITAAGGQVGAPPLEPVQHTARPLVATLANPHERAPGLALPMATSPSTAPTDSGTAPPAPAAPAPAAVTDDTLPAQAAATPAASPTAGPPPIPDWIDIPAIGLEAPVVPASPVSVRVDGQDLSQWSAPDEFAAGWHASSALAGQPGNTVLNGHHNVFGSVFARLHDLVAGDQIMLWGNGQVFFYEVERVMVLEERGAPLAQRQENARWIMPSQDERLTLVTCWPPDNNTHRVIVVARLLQP